jgi:hypothetical protein
MGPVAVGANPEEMTMMARMAVTRFCITPHHL